MQFELTIVIPTLNEEVYLPLLLEDLSTQTNKHFEVVVVDAKSKDSTKEKALSFKKKLAISFIESPKRNVAHQRNLGAKKAKSAYLFFMDADARVSANLVDTVISHINTDNSLLYLPLITPSNPVLINRLLVGFTIKSVMLLQKIKKPLGLGPFIVIQKKFFNTIGGFDEKAAQGEDHNIVIKAYRHGEKAKFLKDVICEFSMRRFDTQGTWKVVRQYAVFTAEVLTRGAVYSNRSSYEMGGHRHKKE